MKQVMLAVGISTFFLTACKKEDPETFVSEENSTPAYEFPNKAGSYWAYNWYSIDSSGVETLLSQVDSLFVLGDTIINGNTYAIYRGNNMSTNYITYFQRDSSGYIVNEHGDISFSYVDNSPSELTGTEPGFWDYYARYLQGLFPVTVPAGTFQTYVAELKVISIDGNQINVCGDTTYSFNTHYASGIGVVQNETAYFSEFETQCKRRIRRLVDYYIP